jgi:hypothetical protein
MASPQPEGRIISREISNSDKFAELSPKAAVLFAMMIPWFNVHGKMNGGPGFIKDEICPKIKYLTYENIPVLLHEISEKTNVKWFKYEGRYWLHSLKFNTEHQKLNKKGVDKLPSFSPELVADLYKTSKIDDDKKVSEVEVEVEEEVEELKQENNPLRGPFQIPDKEQIENQSSVQTENNIQAVAKSIYDDGLWPKVFAFVNTCKKKNLNERAILHTLTKCYLSKPDDPWAYAVGIMKVEDGNFNERDFTKAQR